MPKVRLPLILQAASAVYERYMLRKSRSICAVTRYDLYFVKDRALAQQNAEDQAPQFVFVEQAKIESVDIAKWASHPAEIVALVKVRSERVPLVLTQSLLRHASGVHQWDLLRALAVRYRERSIDDVCNRWNLDGRIKSRIQLLSIRLRNHSAKILEFGADGVHLQIKVVAPLASLVHLIPAVHAYAAAVTHIGRYGDTVELTLLDRLDSSMNLGPQIVIFVHGKASLSLGVSQEKAG